MTHASFFSEVLAPKCVAVVGATEDEQRVGGRLLANLRRNFRGEIVPISKRHTAVQGIPTAPSIKDMSSTADLVFVAVPAVGVLDVMEDAVSAGARCVVILSAGFADAGAEGREIQLRLTALAKGSQTRLIGPNTIGVVNLDVGLVGTFTQIADTQPGKVAVVTQSGGMGSELFSRLQKAGTPASFFVATGNEADVTASELVEAAVDNPSVDVVVACIEGWRDSDRFLEAGRMAAETGKSILLTKIGSSDSGARAAAGHTGAITTDDEAFTAAMRSVGIVMLESPRLLAEYVPAFLGKKVLAGNRLAILTTSGGNGIYLADAASRAGFRVPEFPAEDQRHFTEMMPPFASPINPVDTTASVMGDPLSVSRLVSGILDSDAIDALIAFGIDTLALKYDPDNSLLPALISASQVSSKPFLIVAQDMANAATLNGLGIPAITDHDRAVGALSALLHRTENWSFSERSVASTEAVRVARALLVESEYPQPESLGLLSTFGVPVVASRIVSSADEAVAVAAEFGYPVVVKVFSERTVHKSDVGAVVLDLRSASEVREAAERILSAKDTEPDCRLEVQAMVTGGLELFCGARRVDGVGPVVVVGVGGHLVEILKISETVLASEDDAAIARAVRRLCNGRLTTHLRGLSDVDFQAAVTTIGHVATLMHSLPEITSLDVNPIMVSNGSAVVVDAVIYAARSIPESS